MATIFTPYDLSNSESDLHKHTGEQVELIGEPYAPDADEPDSIMQKIRFADGTTAEAFTEELTEVN